MGKQYKSGNATVEIKEDMEDMFLNFLKTVAPNFEKTTSEALERIEREAIKDWPKRKPRIRTDKDGNIVFFRETTQESYKKFVRGVRVDPDGNFVVFLRNTAPYSFIVKYGEDSRNKDGKPIIKPQGKFVAQETLVSPLKKSTNKVLKALLKDLSKEI